MNERPALAMKRSWSRTRHPTKSPSLYSLSTWRIRKIKTLFSTVNTLMSHTFTECLSIVDNHLWGVAFTSILFLIWKITSEIVPSLPRNQLLLEQHMFLQWLDTCSVDSFIPHLTQLHSDCTYHYRTDADLISYQTGQSTNFRSMAHILWS